MLPVLARNSKVRCFHRPALCSHHWKGIFRG